MHYSAPRCSCLTPPPADLALDPRSWRRYQRVTCPSHGRAAVQEVYADGGLAGPKNPAPEGGTWAWCHVRFEDRGEPARPAPALPAGLRTLVASDYGYVVPEFFGTPAAGNNQMEALAVLLALEALPNGWTGIVHTDSGLTITRFRSVCAVTMGHQDYTAAMVGLPQWFVARMFDVARRLGPLTWINLSGHATAAEIATGIKYKPKPGGPEAWPVSPFNVWCDQHCTKARAERSQYTEGPQDTGGAEDGIVQHRGEPERALA